MKNNILNKSNYPQQESKYSELYLNEKIECKICEREISSYTFIIITKDQYCIPCFAQMRKWPADYQVINKLGFTVFDHNWTAYEQISLFQGLQKHGFGNWNEIAEFINTAKTKQDVELHYEKFFLSQPDYLPDSNTFPPRRASLQKNTKGYKNKNQRNRQLGVLKRNYNSNQELEDSKPTPIEVVGYMPLRADFQFEYDNEAQLLLAEMQFNEEDTKQEQQLKFKILDLYNERLTQRNKRKSFVMSRGLLDLEKQIQIQKNRPKFDKQIYNMMKIFARFQKAQDHERLIQGFIKEKVLKDKIQQYRQLRSKGFTTKRQIQAELEKKSEAKSKKKFNQYSYRNVNQNRNRRHNDHLDGSVFKKNTPYLSGSQIDLCKQLKLSGITYMLIKQTILRQQAKWGSIEREQIMEIFSIQKFIINSIINYLADSQGVNCRS